MMQTLRFQRSVLFRVASATLLAGGLAGPGFAAPPAPGIDLESCHVRGVAQGVLCGSFEVAEDPSSPADGRRLALDVVVVSATSPQPDAEPVFILAGGPGQAATAVVPGVVPSLTDLAQHHDLVFVDQRGTGADDPLRCEAAIEEERKDAMGGEEASGDLGDDPETTGGLEEQFLEQDVQELVQRCLETLDADPRFYTTPIGMDDIDAVRSALGYERIHLWGGSYGTRAGLVYLDRHGDHVVTAILDGAAPVQMALPAEMAIDAERALDRVVEDCAAQSGCVEAFPEIRQRLVEVLDRLEADPAHVTVAHPVTGESTEVVLTRPVFAGYLRSILYDASATALLPLVIEDAAQERYESFVALSWQSRGGESGGGISLGLFLSVVCAEDQQLIDREAAREAVAETFFGGYLIEVIEEACEVWPAGELPEDYFEPVVSDLPILVLSGDLDPVTPPRWGERLAEPLSRATHLVVPATGHGTLRAGCAVDLITEFIETDGESFGDPSCLERLERPRFFVNRLGPGSPDVRAEDGATSDEIDQIDEDEDEEEGA